MSSTTVSGDAMYFGGAEPGKISLAGPESIYENYELSFPEDDVVLYVGSGDNQRECGKIIAFNQSRYVSTSDNHHGPVYVGGTFQISEMASGGISDPEQCTEDAEITLVYKE